MPVHYTMSLSIFQCKTGIFSIFWTFYFFHKHFKGAIEHFYHISRNLADQYHSSSHLSHSISQTDKPASRAFVGQTSFSCQFPSAHGSRKLLVGELPNPIEIANSVVRLRCRYGSFTGIVLTRETEKAAAGHQ